MSSDLRCLGVRGATVALENTADAILGATRELLRQLMTANAFTHDDVAAAFFTTTPDLNATFPARAARQLGWSSVAMLDGHEIDVPESLARCIRVLVLVNTSRTSDQLVPVYLRGAEILRTPVDLVEN
jgi:chorismate mutase